MAYNYYINGERGDAEMHENSGENATTKKLRKHQIDNYMIATGVQLWLGFSAVISYISAYVAMFNNDMNKWFSRHLAGLICIGFIGVISAAKSLYRHKASDYENDDKLP